MRFICCIQHVTYLYALTFIYELATCTRVPLDKTCIRDHSACKPIAHPCPKVAPHKRMKAGTIEASANISDACRTIDIFKAAICALILSKEYVQGGLTFGRTRQSSAVPPSCITLVEICRA